MMIRYKLTTTTIGFLRQTRHACPSNTRIITPKEQFFIDLKSSGGDKVQRTLFVDNDQVLVLFAGCRFDISEPIAFVSVFSADPKSLLVFALNKPEVLEIIVFRDVLLQDSFTLQRTKQSHGCNDSGCQNTAFIADAELAWQTEFCKAFLLGQVLLIVNNDKGFIIIITNEELKMPINDVTLNASVIDVLTCDCFWKKSQ